MQNEFRFSSNVVIGDRTVGPGHAAYLIAEIGPNHNGSFDEAERLIDAAKEAGCDAVKFQYHIAKAEIFDRTTRSYYYDESRYDFIRRVQEFSNADHMRLRQRVRDHGLGYLCSIFSEEAAELVADLDPDGFKIPSGEVGNPWLLENVGKCAKPVVASSGMSPISEIDTMMEVLGNVTDQVVLLHCISEYPTELKDMNLNVIPSLAKRYGCPIGLSDHSRRFSEIAASVALGSSMIEVHFTFDRKSAGPDHHVSVTPDEMKDLVASVRNLEKAMGQSEKQLGAHVGAMRESFTNSIVARRDIEPGDVLSRSNLALKKPGTGLNTNNLADLLGHKARNAIKADAPLKLDDVK
jgi:N,N'-diacetyllegionaminate synthase